MSLRTLTFAAFAVLVLGPLTPDLDAKRGPPPVVTPLVVKDVEYRASYEQVQDNRKPASLRNFVTAHDAKTGKKLWTVLVFEIKYKAELETDVQDVYITALKWDPAGDVVISTERKESFRLNVAKKTVVTEPVVAPGK